MALLNKLFPAKKKNIKHSNCNISCKPFPFSKEQVRVLLYRECDWRGRKLLFDSTAVHKVPLTDTQTSTTKQHFVEVLDGFGYKFLRQKADTISIGEMIFGAVAMAYRGTSLKVHWLSSPARLLCTQVFMSPLTTRTLQSASSCSRNQLESISDQSAGRSCYSSWESSLNTADALDRTLITSTLDDQSNTYSTIYTFAESSAGDSGYNASPRSSGNMTSRSSLSQSDCSFHTYSSASSHNSSQRKTIPNISTSFETDLASCRTSEAFTNKNVDGRRAKLGLAVCVVLTDTVESEMQYYYMEHIPLIESMMNRLQASVKQAYIEKSSFLSIMIKGFERAAQFIYDLFCGPRISEPFWINLAHIDCDFMTNDFQDNVNQKPIAKNFIDRLCKLLNMFDTKGTNFFISTLITAILTHHLGWVSTIIPNNKPANNVKEEMKMDLQYNTLWNQLSDLYGANGCPLKLSKTIVSGSDAETLDEILTVLTYFIRCGEVQRSFIEPILDDDLVDSIMNNFHEFRSHNVSSFHNKHLPTIFTSQESQDINMNHKIEAHDLGLCKPHCGLRNKDSLFNLTICSLLHDQTCEYINLRHKQIDKPNKFTSNKNTCTIPIDESSTILYHLKSNEDNLVDNQTDSSTNIDRKYVTKLQNTTVVQKGLENKYEHVDQIVCDILAAKHEDQFPKSNSNLRKRNKESYPNLSALITKNSLGCNFSQVQEDMDGSNERLKSEVFFILGENEELLGLNKNKIIPKVDKEFVRSPNEHIAAGNNINEDIKQVDLESQDAKYDDKVLPICSTNVLETNGTQQEIVKLNLSKSSCVNAKPFQNISTKPNMPSGVELFKRIIHLPLPKSHTISNYKHFAVNPGFATSLLGGVTDHYVSDMVLQGIRANPETFESSLRSDLALSTHGNALLDQDISESVCIVGNLDKWEVQVVSSHTYIFTNGIAGNVTAMSQLVANMLESVQQMWKLKTSAEYCIMHIENKLRDMYLKSEALAEMLLCTDFCEMSWLTSSLGIEVADMPLLMSIASTHSPQVTKKYGLAFR